MMFTLWQSVGAIVAGLVVMTLAVEAVWRVTGQLKEVGALLVFIAGSASFSTPIGFPIGAVIAEYFDFGLFPTLYTQWVVAFIISMITLAIAAGYANRRQKRHLDKRLGSQTGQ
jgi:Na+/H+ antiporter NhaD/arsenite permease-like protein